MDIKIKNKNKGCYPECSRRERRPAAGARAMDGPRAAGTGCIARPHRDPQRARVRARAKEETFISGGREIGGLHGNSFASLDHQKTTVKKQPSLLHFQRAVLPTVDMPSRRGLRLNRRLNRLVQRSAQTRSPHPLPMAATRLQPLRAEEHPGSGTPNLACKAKMRRSAARGRGCGPRARF